MTIYDKTFLSVLLDEAIDLKMNWFIIYSNISQIKIDDCSNFYVKYDTVFVEIV